VFCFVCFCSHQFSFLPLCSIWEGGRDWGLNGE
jgi:hypothetical protein